MGFEDQGECGVFSQHVAQLLFVVLLVQALIVRQLVRGMCCIHSECERRQTFWWYLR